MKILLLAPIHFEKEFLRQKKQELEKFGKIINPFPLYQGQNSWYHALKELGHQVKVFYYTRSVLLPDGLRVALAYFLQKILPIWYARFLRLRSLFYCLSLDNYLRNRKIIAKALDFQPDLIIISGGTTVIFPRTVKFLKKKLGCKIILLNGMDPQTCATVTEKKMLPFLDTVFTNDRFYAQGWEKLEAKKAICLPLSYCDPQIHKKINLTPEEKRLYSCDVCFVGTLTLERQKILGQLLEFNLKVWGDLLPDTPLLPQLTSVYQGQSHGEKMVKIFNAAKIVLNFQPKEMKYGGNMRTFEIPGCGAFQLADKVDPQWFEIGKEIVVFSDILDLKNKLCRYLKNEKERIAVAWVGHAKALRNHTYEKHFAKLLSQV